MSILKTSIVTILALATACSQKAAFQPTEPTAVTSPSGQPAAAYDIRTEPNTDPRIHVNVWSEGAARDRDRTHVDLAFEIRNTGDRPVTLDRSQLALSFRLRWGLVQPGGESYLQFTEFRRKPEAPVTAAGTTMNRAAPAPIGT